MKEMVVCVVCLTLIAAPIEAPSAAADARTKALLAGLASAASTIIVMVALNEDVEKQYLPQKNSRKLYLNLLSVDIFLGCRLGFT